MTPDELAEQLADRAIKYAGQLAGIAVAGVAEGLLEIYDIDVPLEMLRFDQQ